MFFPQTPSSSAIAVSLTPAATVVNASSISAHVVTALPSVGNALNRPMKGVY